MCVTTWTQDDLAAIEAAIATGAKEVFYGDKKVVYHSLRELLEARDVIKAALCPDPALNGYGRRRHVASFSTGL